MAIDQLTGETLPDLPGAGFPLVPLTSTSTRAPGTTTTRPVITDEEKRNADAIARNNADALKATKTAADLAVQKAKIQQQQALAEAQVRDQFRSERVKQLDANEKAVQSANAAHQREFDVLRSVQEPKDFWKERGTVREIMGAIAQAVGGYVSGSTGGRNPGGDIINGAIERDAQAQRERVQRRLQLVEMAKGDIVTARQTAQDALVKIDLREAAGHKVVADRFAAELGKLGVPLAEAEQNKLVAEQNGKSLEKLQKIFEANRARVTTGTPSRTITNIDPRTGAAGKPPTETQAKLAIFGQQIKDDLRVLANSRPVAGDVFNKFQDTQLSVEAADKTAEGGIGGSLAVGLGRGLGILPRSPYEGINPGDQKSLNAYQSVVTTMTHYFTGAGMPFQEARQKALMYAPRPGSSQELIDEQMARAQALAAQMSAAAGPGITATVEASARRAPAKGVAPGQPSAAGRNPPPEPKKRAADPRIGLAREALKAGSGATTAEKAQAIKILRAAGEM